MKSQHVTSWRHAACLGCRKAPVLLWYLETPPPHQNFPKVTHSIVQLLYNTSFYVPNQIFLSPHFEQIVASQGWWFPTLKWHMEEEWTSPFPHALIQTRVMCACTHTHTHTSNVRSGPRLGRHWHAEVSDPEVMPNFKVTELAHHFHTAHVQSQRKLSIHSCSSRRNKSCSRWELSLLSACGTSQKQGAAISAYKLFPFDGRSGSASPASACPPSPHTYPCRCFQENKKHIPLEAPLSCKHLHENVACL